MTERITYISAGGYHNAALSERGYVYTWGRGDVGQLGFEDERALEKDSMGYVLTYPKQTGFRNIEKIALGEAHTMVLDQSGRLRVFGWDELG